MSSFTRRIQRGLSPSLAIHPTIVVDDEGNEKVVGFHSNPPRLKFFGGRGSRLGVTRNV